MGNLLRGVDGIDPLQALFLILPRVPRQSVEGDKIGLPRHFRPE